jgi:hypothetical protein
LLSNKKEEEERETCAHSNFTLKPIVCLQLIQTQLGATVEEEMEREGN